MSTEENSPGGILSAADAEALLIERATPKEEETETAEAEEVEASEETQETEFEQDEAEEVESDEVLDDEATDDPEEVDDTAEEIDAEELNRGYLRQADYTRKTQELAAERAQLKAQTEQFEAHAQQQLSALEEAVKAFSVPTEAEPDWPKLAKELDPKDYNAKQAEWSAKQAKAQQAKAIQENIAAEQHEATRQKEAALLLERIPEWKDAKVYQAESAEIVSVASEFGFSPEEVNGILDHRQIQILRTLAVAKRAEKAAAKKQAKPRKKVNAAASPQKVDEREIAQRERSARFKKTGSVDDAMAMLMAR